jgi:hypothetical protein
MVLTSLYAQMALQLSFLPIMEMQSNSFDIDGFNTQETYDLNIILWNFTNGKLE